MSNVLYSTDGAGYWCRTTWKPQCGEKVFISNQCQGVEGHTGEHWSYAEDGSYLWHDNENDPDSIRDYDGDPDLRGVAGSIPPRSDEYVDPRQMAPLYYTQSYEDVVITDPTEIARLEAGGWEAEGAMITRPCTEEFGEQCLDCSALLLGGHSCEGVPE